MKIGILTQPLRTNYGGVLQNYALQQILIRHGYDTETILYSSPKIVSLLSYIIQIKKTVLHFLSPKKYKAPKYEPDNNERAIIKKNIDYFIDKYISTTEPLRTREDFLKVGSEGRYQVYVVGSDQCWRPMYNKIFLREMFLSFVEEKRNIKRIAYAASFGTSKWEMNSKTTQKCSKLAQLFDLITVREDSGMILCKDYLSVDAKLVLDPTMLLLKEDYTNLIEEEKEPQSKGNLFYYFLDPNIKKESIVNHIGDKFKLTPFTVMPKYRGANITIDNVKNDIFNCVFPPVTKWLKGFLDAEMTVVDSFHGMVFSIIYNKPFWVVGNKKRGMSRFTSLLKMLNLEDRLIDETEIYMIEVNKPIDWKRVNEIIRTYRQESIKLLLGALGNE